jgi:hypothetical protein
LDEFKVLEVRQVLDKQKKDYTENIHPDLLAAQEIAYEPSGLKISKLIKEAESKKYGAFKFNINEKHINFRVAKITPTKNGQFVTLWKRIGAGPILPYDMEDPVDLFVVSVRDNEHFGQFVFPKNILYEKGIVSKEGKGGKRAMRVYPPWDTADSRQAQKTQMWQNIYFLDIPTNKGVDSSRVHTLYGHIGYESV